jgi:hypothetical protein
MQRATAKGKASDARTPKAKREKSSTKHQHNGGAPPPQYALAAALTLATKRDWYVFPLKHGERASYKSAEYSDGRKWGMTKDLDEIQRDWEEWPYAGIGIPLEANGLIILDWESLAVMA